MKRLPLLLLLLVSATVLGADLPDDGIYLRAQDDSAPWMISQDGQTVSLGVRQELKIQESTLTSQSNANDKFYLGLTIPYDENLNSTAYILVISGTVYRQIGSGSSQKETSSLSFYISGEENAKQVAKFLKTSVVYRKHPQHNLRVSFIPTKQEFSVGEEVTATLQIKNVGTNSISFMKGGRNRAERDNQYIFSARHDGKQVDDIGTSYHFGGIAVRREMKPGDVFEDKISLSKWFAFDKAGMFEIHGSYYLNFNDPETQSFGTIWEDYVSADFTVHIKEQEKAPSKEPEATR
jgi:hypothetical protein